MGPKVRYRTLGGATSTAYLDEEPGDSAWGSDKYTDAPVLVEWVEAAAEWREAPWGETA